jgi:hypothetical protein
MEIHVFLTLCLLMEGSGSAQKRQIREAQKHKDPIHCLKLTMATISKRKQTKASIIYLSDIEVRPNVDLTLNGLLLTYDMSDS